MNLLNIVESIQQVFPKVSRTQIRLDVDTAQKLIADETGVITTLGSLSSPTTNTAWSLPSGFLRLNSVNLYDADNNPVYLEEENYKYEIEFDKFYIYSSESTPISGLDCTYAYIHYDALPDTLTSESSEMDLTEHYRDAVESYVLSKYFAKFPIAFVSGGQVVEAINPNLAQLHESRYEKLRIKIKRLFNSRNKTDNHYYNYDYAGKFILPKRAKDDSVSTTVSVAAIAELYSKYAYFKITAVGDQTPVVSSGYTSLTCSVTGNTVTLSSTADFDASTIVNINDPQYEYTYISSSSITLEVLPGWSSIAFEIYERS